jgi:hypothetical protein
VLVKCYYKNPFPQAFLGRYSKIPANHEAHDTEAQGSEAQDTEAQDTEIQDLEAQGTEAQYRKVVR